MSTTKNVALVSITINAVDPMTEYIRKHVPELQPVNYLDGFLMEKVRKEGGISDASMGRMTRMLSTACEDGNEGIIITCTVFSPYQPALQQLFSVPVICADAAMLDRLAVQTGRTAIICTFEGTVDVTRNSYYKYRRLHGMPEEVDMYPVPAAFQAAQRGDLQASNALIAEKIKELDEQYDQIALAQISMAGAADLVSLRHAKLFTSPECALEQLKEALEGKQGRG